MLEAQREFDARAGPLCPSQLTAPVLHNVLSYPAVQVSGRRRSPGRSHALARCRLRGAQVPLSCPAL
jgi:galactokinase